MSASATELMKQLKYIEAEINDIHRNDEEKSTVPAVETVVDNRTTLAPLYEGTYNFEDNRNRIRELFSEEREIKRILSRFNNETMVEGYDFTIAEGLVRIAELKSEIKVLTNITKGGEYVADRYSSSSVKMAVFDVRAARKVLKEYQRELSALQVAVDKTNLNSKIEY